ncbi:MAG: UDP-glucose 6-dehydrogenase [Gammaproteobacteria bacterium RIFCSPHIGHO2_12_FULL_35_23]|nr:MAG: UDP-glucose 6-dehydrogenase [Gammaproteobacteria bacterium RIFCSPHIGHO2_12_FULL_35_23]
MTLKVTVIGAGYVGLTTAACFAQLGHEVHCIDINEIRIAELKQGKLPIYEPGLQELVIKNVQVKRLQFVFGLENVPVGQKIYIIAVGTPMQEDGSANTSYVEAAARNIAKHLNDYAVIITKSTVPVGTAEKIHNIIKAELLRKNKKIQYSVVSNPEFLKQGDAVKDCLYPNRVIVGVDDQRASEIMKQLYVPMKLTSEQYLEMGIKDAEMTKYAANAMLATKISFINEMANICEKIGANVENIKRGIGSDSRIGFAFLNAGCGYGGSCFPKDVRALIFNAEQVGVDAKLLKAVELRNELQKYILVQKLLNYFASNIKDKTFAVWGLAFKPDTDDMREASAVIFITEAIKRGAKIKAYDPQAMLVAQKMFPAEYFKNGLMLVSDKETAVENADGLVVITEWPEFKTANFKELQQKMKGKLILDGRNCLPKEKITSLAMDYIGVGI